MTLSNEEDRYSTACNWPWEEKCDPGCISTRSSFCPLTLLIFIAFHLDRRTFSAQFEVNIRSDEHNLILGKRTVFVQSVSSVDMQCTCKPPIIICCRHRRPKESNMNFPWFSVEVALSIFSVECFLKAIFRRTQ